MLLLLLGSMSIVFILSHIVAVFIVSTILSLVIIDISFSVVAVAVAGVMTMMILVEMPMEDVGFDWLGLYLMTFQEYPQAPREAVVYPFGTTAFDADRLFPLPSLGGTLIKLPPPSLLLFDDRMNNP